MLAVFFRLINDDGPTGKTGLAVGNSYHEIFLAIDEVGDPYYCEIAKLPRKKRGNWTYVSWTEEKESGAMDDESLFETSMNFPSAFDDEEWVKPPWIGDCQYLFKALGCNNKMNDQEKKAYLEYCHINPM